MLEIPGLTFQEQASIFALRCEVYLKLGKYETAKTYADWIIQCWPSWWKGYLCLGKAQNALYQYVDAMKSLEFARILNASSEEINDVLNVVKIKV